MSDTNYPDGDWSFLTGVKKDGVILAPPNNGAGLDDINKISHSIDCEFSNITIHAGMQRENAVDINNEACRNKLTHYVVDAGGQPALYIKGGSCDNVIDDFLIVRPGGHCDLMVGDFSDQSKKKNTGNKFNNVRRIDALPVRVRWNFLRAEKPKLTNSKVKYLYFRSLLSTIYVELKYLFT